MKNPIKQYFCFFSTAPFSFSVTLFISYIIGSMIATFLDGGNVIEELSKSHLAIASVIIIINLFVVYIIRNKFITTNNSSEAPIRLFDVLVTKEGEKILITKPIWKKGVKYIITRENFELSLDYNELKGKTETRFCIQGRYKNSLVKVPGLLTLKCDGEIDKINLFDILIKNCPIWESCYIKNQKELRLDDYLATAFKKANEKNQSKFDEIISRYAQLTISDAEFLSEILDAIEFPEKIFSCVIDTKICLGNPETSACKGVMCETK